MKKVLFVLAFLGFITNVNYASPNRVLIDKKEAISVKDYKKQMKKQQKIERKKAKLKKKLGKLEQKLQKKMKKKGIKATSANSVWDDSNFKLGALIGLGGLLLTILGFLPILGGIFGVIGVIMLVVGLGIMIWTLIDSY
jgi:Flp pilus assembly protein TadB